MNQSVSFGERLREERLKLGMSQAALGAAGGVTKKTQMLYESGERSPDGVYLSAIAAAGVDLQYVLLELRSPKEQLRAGITLRVEQEQAGYAVEVLSKEEQALLDNYRHCSGEVRQAAKAQLAAMAKPKGKIKKAG